MNNVGTGVREIGIRDERGAFRVAYVTRFAGAVYVLHCFQKKTQRTSPRDLEIAIEALQGIAEGAQIVKARFENVWDAIEKTPALAANMKVRSALMLALTEHIREQGLSQSQAAKKFGVTQPRISDLTRGRVDLFAIDTLVNMLAMAGMQVQLRIGKAA